MKNSEIFGLIIAKIIITFGCLTPIAAGMIMMKESSSFLFVVGLILVCAGGYAYVALSMKYLVSMGMEIGWYIQKHCFVSATNK